MAKPSVENGFLMVPLDLLPAVMTADLPNGEMIVLAEAMLQRYGAGRRERVVLDPPTIEAATGMSCKNVRRAAKGLTAARILVPAGGNLYLVNDDYETWTPGERPYTDRLGGGLVRFCLGALARFGKRNKPSEGVGVQVDSPTTTVLSPVRPLSDARKTSGWTPTIADATDEHVGANGTMPTPSDVPRVRVAPASEDIRDEKCSSGGLGACEHDAPLPEPNAAKWKALPEDYRAEWLRARAYALGELPDKGGDKIARYMAQHPRPVDGMPAWWWTTALNRLGSTEPGEVEMPVRYIRGLLEAFCKEAPVRLVAPPPSANGEAPARQPTPEELEAADRAFAERCRARLARERKGGGR